MRSLDEKRENNADHDWVEYSGGGFLYILPGDYSEEESKDAASRSFEAMVGRRVLRTYFEKKGRSVHVTVIPWKAEQSFEVANKSYEKQRNKMRTSPKNNEQYSDSLPHFGYKRR